MTLKPWNERNIKFKSSVKPNDYSFIIQFDNHDPFIYRVSSHYDVLNVQHIINSISCSPLKQELDYDLSHEIYKKYNSFRKKICKLNNIPFENQVPKNWYGQSFIEQRNELIKTVLAW